MINVLLIEDVAAHAELFLLSVEQRDPPIQVNVVRDGEAARDVLGRIASGKASPPDAVLLDLSLPLVSGHELLEFIRATPELRDMPVVITTSSQDNADVVRSAELGVSGYLIKPVQVTQLDSIFARLFPGR